MSPGQMKTPPETVAKIKAEHPESWDKEGNYVPTGIPEIGEASSSSKSCRATGCEIVIVIAIIAIGGALVLILIL